MDGFTYHDIFQTKGIEYIIIILFLLLLIPFWIIINKNDYLKTKIKKAVRFLTRDTLRVPRGVFISPMHTWAFMEKSGMAKIGPDDLLALLAGEVDLEFLKKPGEEVKRGDLIAEVGVGGKKLQIISPVSGTISRPNHSLAEQRHLFADDPYGQGWIYEISPSAWKEETNSYRLGEEAVSWTYGELDRFKDFLAKSMVRHSLAGKGIILQEGGEIMAGSLAEMPEQIWVEFQEEFLSDHH
ncbi:MAG: hypothetical protein KBC43_09780 [Bacteroidales bacterium]|nr:hypothetical protein [Bacteroidales bacterium]